MEMKLDRVSHLPSLVKELGFSCAVDEVSFKELVLAKCPKPSEAIVAETLFLLSGVIDEKCSRPPFFALKPSCSIRSLTESVWNVKNVIHCIKDVVPGLNWTGVANFLDFEGFLLEKEVSFVALMEMFKYATQEHFPRQALLGKVWKNVEGQLSFLRYAVIGPQEYFSFEGTKLLGETVKDEVFRNAYKAKYLKFTANYAYISVELYQTLCLISEAELPGNRTLAWCREILQYPAQYCPELVLLGVASCETEWNPLKNDVFLSLLPYFIMKKEGSSSDVVRVLSRMAPHSVAEVLASLINNPQALPRVLDTCQDLGNINAVLARLQYPMNFEAAMLAAKRGLLNFEGWLLENDTGDYAVAALRYLSGALHHLMDPQFKGRLEDTLLSAASVKALIVFVQKYVGVMPPDDAKMFQNVRAVAARLFVGLDGPGSGGGVATEGFSVDVENEVNGYFSNFFTQLLSVEEMVSKMKSLKNAPDARSVNVYNCLIHNLYDEYKFFRNYPKQQLRQSAALLGSLVKHRVITGRDLKTALTFVLKALQTTANGGRPTPASSNMFIFGLDALREFASQPQPVPEFYAGLLSSTELASEDPELCATIRRVVEENSSITRAGDDELAKGDVMGGSSQGGSLFSAASKPIPMGLGPLAKLVNGDPSAPSSTNASSMTLKGVDVPDSASPALTRPETASLALVNTESLESAAEKYKVNFKEPPVEVTDRIHFLMNNLTMSNLAEKSEEIKTKIVLDYLKWFANYMVSKRAAQEANFHQLYMSLLEKLNDKKLYKQMVSTTLYYVKALLYSERIIKESNDRSLLKNLGSWLGLLTFANNKPLLSKDLEVKTIIIEAYERGRLMSVLPFIQKLLECCKDSKVFRPTNPMIAGILSVLAELHSMKDLKINNMFSIELVFRAFGFKPSDIAPSDVLKMRTRENKSNPDWSVPQEPMEPKGMGGAASSSTLAGGAGARAGSTNVPPSSTPSRASPLPSVVPGGGDQGKVPAMIDAVATATHSAAATVTSISPMSNFMQQAPGASPTAVMSSAGVSGPLMQLENPNLFATLYQHVVIHPNLSNIAERLQLKRQIPIAVDRAICEIMSQAIERSVSLAIRTTAELVVKDFAFEADEMRMRTAAHQMVSSLTGCLSLFFGKDPLRTHMSTQLRGMLQGQLDTNTLDQVVSVVVADNLELGCKIIESTTVDHAVREIDKSLAPYYEDRLNARKLGKAWTPSESFITAQQCLPEGLRSVGRQSTVQSHLSRVYEEFGKIQRMTPTSSATPVAVTRFPHLPGADALDRAALMTDKYQVWQQAVDMAVAAAARDQNPSMESMNEIRALLDELVMSPSLGGGGEEVVLTLGRRILRHLWEVAADAMPQATTFALINTYVACLDSLSKLSRRMPMELTSLYWSDDERRFDKVVVDSLLRCRLLNLPEFDRIIVKALGVGGQNKLTILVIHLIQACIVRDALFTCDDIPATFDYFSKLAFNATNNNALLSLIEQARKVSSSQVAQICRAPGEVPPTVRDRSDPNNLKERSAALFDEWVRAVNGPDAEKQGMLFLLGLRDLELFQHSEYTDRFFCLLIDISVEHCLASNVEAAVAAATVGSRPQDLLLNFLATDALVLLVTALVYNGGGEAILTRFLSILTAVIKRDADERGGKFNARPYLRIWVGLLSDLGTPDKAFIVGRPPAPLGEQPSETVALAAIRYLKICGVFLYQLQPISVPGFAFAWLELISHRAFLPKMLGPTPSAAAATPAGLQPSPASPAGGNLYFSLLAALLRFLETYLRHADLPESIKQLYRGTLRLLLVLLQDFPDVLCEHHLQLCEVIAPTAVQMRNLVLSAYPKNMHLPDPFLANLKVDLLPETQVPPRMVLGPTQLLPDCIASKVQEFLSVRQPAVLPQELAKLLVFSPMEAKTHGTTYNVLLLNALVLYIGVQAKSLSSPYHAAAQELFLRLANELDSEGRYLMLNAMANHLRYPNAHTYYFSCSLLNLFLEAPSEVLKEQITRVLLERLLVNRPHPWGLLITFIELIKNRRYNFWSHNFTKCAPEIESVFNNLSRTFGGPCGRGEEEPLNSSLTQKDSTVRT